MGQNSKGTRRVIISVQHAIDILNLFDHRRSELGTTEIGRAMGLPKSTIAGLVKTLEANHLLEQNKNTRKYRLGAKLLEYSGILLKQTDLRVVSQPFLEDLLQWCNESVNLAIWDGGYVVYIERLFGTHHIGIHSEIGKRESLHSTALGKAILSCFSQRDILDIIGRHKLRPKTPYTLVDQAELIKDIQVSRDRGYALDNEENELGGRCVAAPIFDFRGKPLGALSISAPLQRMPEPDIPLFGGKVRDVAGAISRRLGYLADEQ